MIKQSFQVVAGALAFALWLFLMAYAPIVASELLRTSRGAIQEMVDQAGT